MSDESCHKPIAKLGGQARDTRLACAASQTRP